MKKHTEALFIYVTVLLFLSFSILVAQESEDVSSDNPHQLYKQATDHLKKKSSYYFSYSLKFILKDTDQSPTINGSVTYFQPNIAHFESVDPEGRTRLFKKNKRFWVNYGRRWSLLKEQDKEVYKVLAGWAKDKNIAFDLLVFFLNGSQKAGSKEKEIVNGIKTHRIKFTTKKTVKQLYDRYGMPELADFKKSDDERMKVTAWIGEQNHQFQKVEILAPGFRTKQAAPGEEGRPIKLKLTLKKFDYTKQKPEQELKEEFDLSKEEADSEESGSAEEGDEQDQSSIQNLIGNLKEEKVTKVFEETSLPEVVKYFQDNLYEKIKIGESVKHPEKIQISMEFKKERADRALRDILYSTSLWFRLSEENVIYIEDDKDRNPKRIRNAEYSLPGYVLKRLGSLRFRTSNPITNLDYSPEGKFLAVTDRTGDLKIWERSTGKLVTEISSRSSNISVMEYFPSGNKVATGHRNGSVKLWNTETGELIKDYKIHSKIGVDAISISSDGKKIASGGESENIKIWKADTGEVIQSVQGYSPKITSLEFLKNGKQLISGGFDKDRKPARLWQINSGKLLRSYRGMKHPIVTDLDISPDEKYFAAGGSSGEIKIFEISSGNVIRTFHGLEDRIAKVKYSPDGNRIAGGSIRGIMRIWDAESGTIQHTISDYTYGLHGMEFSPHGKEIAFGNKKKTVRFINVESGKVIKPATGHEDRITSLAFSPGGKKLITGSNDRTVKLWNLKNGNLINTFRTTGKSRIHSVAFSPDGSLIAAGRTGRIDLWETNSGTRIRSLSKNEDQQYWSITFSPDGNRIASGTGGFSKKVLVWNIKNGNVIHTLEGHNNRIRGLDFSPDGKQLVSGSKDSNIIIWSVDKGKLIRTIRGYDKDANPAGHRKGVSSVKFSSNGAFILSGSYDDTVKLWKADTGENLWTADFDGRSIWSVDYFCDGQSCIAIDHKGTIYLLNAKTGKEFHRFGDNLWSGGFVKAAPGGLSFAASVENSTALSFTLNPEQWDVRLPIQNAHKKFIRILWNELSSENNIRAYQAMFVLINRQEKFTDFLDKKITQLHTITWTKQEKTKLNSLVQKLGAKPITQRNKAEQNLFEFLLEKTLRSREAVNQIINNTEGPEKITRLKNIRRELKNHFRTRPLSGTRLRMFRSLLILQEIGTGKAKSLLKKITKQNPDYPISNRAKKILNHWND